MTLADTLWVMNRGHVEQKGSPLDVYERPRTKFVATFLGSPQMNLVDATLVRREGHWAIDGGGMAAAVDEERFGGSLREGVTVTVGVRPHDFVVAESAAAAVATLKVELVEALGFEAYAYGWFCSSGPRMAVRLEAVAESSSRARGICCVPRCTDLRACICSIWTGRSLATRAVDGVVHPGATTSKEQQRHADESTPHRPLPCGQRTTESGSNKCTR